MELLPLAFPSGWTSGINAHTTAAILLVVGIWVTVAVMRRVRRGWRAFWRWLQAT